MNKKVMIGSGKQEEERTEGLALTLYLEDE
jgi:hypothetical protein